MWLCYTSVGFYAFVLFSQFLEVKMAAEDSGFKVSDRRLFTEDGELREESSKEASNQTFVRESGDVPHLSQNAPNDAEMPMDFQALVFSLSSTALFQLGIAPDPVTGKVEKDLTSAKETIDILGILQDKTKGNLTPEEAHLLNDCVHDLRMAYLKVAQTIK